MTGLEQHIAEIVIGGFVSIFAAIWGLLKWFARTYLDQNEGRFQKLTDKTENLERKLHELELRLPRDYVGREDWMRAVVISDSKVDALSTKLDRLIERKVNDGGR